MAVAVWEDQSRGTRSMRCRGQPRSGVEEEEDNAARSQSGTLSATDRHCIRLIAADPDVWYDESARVWHAFYLSCLSCASLTHPGACPSLNYKYHPFVQPTTFDGKKILPHEQVRKATASWVFFHEIVYEL